MKNIFKLISILSVILFLFSCEERDTDPRIGTDALSAAKFVNTPSGSFTVTAVNLANPFYTFLINRASYGPAIQLNYQLEISKDGTNFSPEVELGEVFTDTNVTVTYQQLNGALAALNLPANISNDVLIRIKATPINSSLNPSYSDAVKITVTPYEPDYDAMFAKLYVPGSYGAASGYSDWSPNNGGSPNLYSAKNDEKYAGFVWMNMTNPEFKFAHAEEGWANNKGDSSDPNTYTTLAPNGPNVKGPYPNATYFIKVDWNGNTYSIAQADMGIIGEATPTGWNSDTKLTFDTTSRTFKLASIALTGGKVFKFRNDNTWSIKIQPQSADTTIVSGKSTQVYNSAEGTVTGDPSFKVADSGNYSVELDLHNSGHYTLKVTKL